MEGSRIPGFYPETPVAPGSRFAVNGLAANSDSQNSPMGSIGKAGGPIRRTPAAAHSRARAYSTPYARPPTQNTPGSGNRHHRPDEDEARIKKSLGEKTVELVGNLVSGVKDWFSSSKTPRREVVQSVVPRKKTPQRSLTSRMEEGLEEDNSLHREDNMFSPSLAPHYAGHTPWIVKQRKGVLSQEPPIFPLPNTNPTHHKTDSQSKYATLPAKRSSAIVPTGANKRPRLQGSSGSLRPPKEWELSRDRFAEQDEETLAWCDKHGIDILALANGTQKRPPLPSFQDIQRYDSLKNDIAFFERQGIRTVAAHQPRHPSSLRHATSSYELSRLPTIGDSTSSNLHAWRELLRLKESRTRAEREAAQLERSKARNGYPTSYKTWSRNSSRVRGPAGDVGEDVWILPSVRPGSAGSVVRSVRMRTSSPQGSLRSMRGRPRGRDVFEGMVDEGVQTGTAGLLAPPPTDSRGMSVEVMEREETPRRKRPGYFSAREEDLDPLDMDVEDFITPAKKKQRISVQGPKFAALWEPSKRDNWPLGEDADQKMEEDKKKEETVEELSKKELKELESPAFKLPPSARKEKDVVMEEQPTPTKDAGKPTTQSPLMKPATNGFNFGFEKPASPEKLTFDLTRESQKPSSPEKPSFSFTTDKPSFSFTSEAPTFDFKSPTSKSTETADEPKETPSKTASFMQSILSDGKTSPEKEEIRPASPEKPKENGVTEKESQPSPPKFQFSLPPTQTSISTSPPKSPVTEKPASTSGFTFGNGTGGFSIGTSSASTASRFSFKPSVTAKETSEEPAKPAAPAVEAPKLSFNFPKPAVEEPKSEEKKAEKLEDKPGTKSAAPLFGFAKPETEEQKKEITAAPVFGTTGGFGSFGGAFAKPEGEKKPLFGAATTTAQAQPTADQTPATNGGDKKSDNADAPTIPLFGSGVSSGFKFGVSAPATEPPKVEATEKAAKQPSVTPASAVPQDLDETMDITESPPTVRNPSIAMTDANVPFGGFKLPAPASAPATTEAPKVPAFNFTAPPEAKTNGTSEKPAFTFSAGISENKPLFGAPLTSASPAFGSPAPSPAPTGFGGFGSAFPKKEEAAPTEQPASQPFSFQSGASTMSFGTSASTAAPSETKPLFGSQPAAPSSAPAFGSANTSLFGGSSAFPSQPAPPVTSPPAVSTAPPSTSTFSFNFNAPSSGTAPTFGSSSTPFTFGASSNAPINNPFAAQSQPAPTTPGFQGISSAPVSPQAPQISSFAPGQSPFGGAPAQNAPLFGATNPAPAPNFQFNQGNIPGTPVFTLGANTMQRSSSDAGPSTTTPGGRRIAQPRRRGQRR